MFDPMISFMPTYVRCVLWLVEDFFKKLQVIKMHELHLYGLA